LLIQVVVLHFICCLLTAKSQNHLKLQEILTTSPGFNLIDASQNIDLTISASHQQTATTMLPYQVSPIQSHIMVHPHRDEALLNLGCTSYHHQYILWQFRLLPIHQKHLSALAFECCCSLDPATFLR
jgi:hypothetical protein